MTRIAQAAARRQAGITLTEIIAATGMLAVLAGVVAPMIGAEVEGARLARATMDMHSVANAFQSYRSHTGVWPSNDGTTITAPKHEPLTSFACLYANVHSLTGWSGPYLNTGYLQAPGGSWVVAGSAPGQGLLDPWSTPFHVVCFPPGGAIGSEGGIGFVSGGPNAALDTATADIAAGVASGDDAVLVVRCGR